MERTLCGGKYGILLLNVIFTINFIYTMKKLIILLFCLLCTISMLRAADTIFVRETQVPVLIERMDNVLYYLHFRQ